MSPIKVALAGATGNLGPSILSALLSSNHYVTVLTRHNSTSPKPAPHPNLTVIKVDFTSIPYLTTALYGIEVVISCLATLAIGSQNPLIDASISAGVKRYIPAEFGMDSLNPLAMELPVCVPKVETQKYLKKKVSENEGFSWTGIANGLFLDWGLDVGFILYPGMHTGTLYNGGDIPFSTTTLADVARAVVGVIGNLEGTKNRILYVHSAVTTQNTLVEYSKDIDGKEWEVSVKDTEEIRKESLVELEKGEEGDVMKAMDRFCVAASWNEEYGCDFSRHLDNDLVGVKLMSEAELRVLVGSFL
jgi:hypothetical protein